MTKAVNPVRTSDYWVQQGMDEALYRRIKRDYEAALSALDADLAAFYARYATNEGISMDAARKLLSEVERETFRMSLDEFMEKAKAGGWDKELNEIYLRSRISRLQALQTQIEARVMALYQSQRDILRDHLASAYADTYYRTIYDLDRGVGFLSTFARLDPETVESIIARPWVGDSFSGRIWKDRDKLTRELETVLSQAIIRGDPLQRTAKLLAKRMGVAESRAMTLVSTESAHAAGQATLRGYKETGVDRYRFIAGFDSKTCDICAAIDGKTFRVSEAQVGVNFNPLHPRCRCATAAVSDFDIGTEKAARDPVTGKSIRIPKDMSYKEWREKYVDNSPEGAILKLTKAEKQAIMRYTGAESYKLNGKLRAGDKLTQREEAWVKSLDKALDKLPRYQGTVTRELVFDSEADLNDFMRNHIPGTSVSYPAYSSATTLLKYHERPHIIQRIVSRTARDLRGVNPGEIEILFGRNTGFQVVSAKIKNGVIEYEMEEIE